MSIKQDIEKQVGEIEWFENEAKKVKRSRQYTPEVRARIAACYVGGARTARAALAELLAKKCQADSLAGLQEMFCKSKGDK